MPIDMTAAKAPPQKRTIGARNTATKSAPKQTNTERREEGLLGIGQVGQFACIMAKQYADAAAFDMHWPGIAREAAVLAETNDTLANATDFLIKAGPFAGLLATALPFALQIMANHRIVDARQLVGTSVVPPEVLETRMRANIAQMQAEARQAQQAAEQRLAEYQDHAERNGHESVMGDMQMPVMEP